MTSWNHGAEVMFGFTASEIIGEPDTILFPPELQGESRQRLEWIRSGSGIIDRESLRIRKDGGRLPVAITLSPLFDSDQKLVGASSITRDISAQKKAEAKFQKLTLLYATLVYTNEAIIYAKDRHELFTNIVKNAVQHGKFAMAWIGISNMETHRVEPDCFAGDEQGYCAKLHISIDDAPESHNPVGMSLRENRPVYVNNIYQDGRFILWRQEDIQRHFQGVASIPFHGAAIVPFRKESQPMGALVLYVNELDFFDTDQIHLLEEMSKTISYALDALEMKERHEKGVQDLRENEEMFRAVSLSAQDAILMLDNDGNITLWNEAAEKIFGYSREETLGKNLHLLIAPTRFHEASQAGFQHFQTTGDGKLVGKTLELSALRKDGTEFPIELSLSKCKFRDKWHAVGIMRDISERKRADLKLRKTLEDSVRAIASTIDARDPYTSGHQQRVAKLAEAIATEMGLPAEQIDGIRFGSLIHDIGKISIPAETLAKPAQLTPLERSIIETHAQAGYEIIKDIDFPWPVALMILQHHERLNGTGYPSKLQDKDIILEAKILAVADTVEAMSSHRPYRAGLGIDAALHEITDNKGTLYDPTVVDICLRLFHEKGFSFT